ncbi:DEAD2 [Trinorchestia longiramus]|nr:DEAD2 [Trinorchestia longiramus]
MYGMNVKAWTRGDLEKLVPQNRVFLRSFPKFYSPKCLLGIESCLNSTVSKNNKGKNLWLSSVSKRLKSSQEFHTSGDANMSQKLVPPDDFSFPFPPYDIQLELMKKVFMALEEEKLAIFESPTGTGKSLSLICSALTWLHMHNEVQQSRLESELRKAEAAVQQCEAADDWFAAAGDRQAQTEAIHAVKEKLSRLNMERVRVEAIRLRKLKAMKEGDASAFSRGVKSCTNKASCAPQETGQTEQCKENLPPTDDHVLLDEELDLLLPDDPEAEADEARVDDEEEGCLKARRRLVMIIAIERSTVRFESREFRIYYCSRTHSQLSQFVGELQRTKFGEERTRVVALASRHNLCINPDVVRLKLPSLVNDR